MPDRGDGAGGRREPIPLCATGAGRRRRTQGPVLAVYVDGAIEVHCPACGAEPLSFCRHPDGTERKLPCLQRLQEAE